MWFRVECYQLAEEEGCRVSCKYAEFLTARSELQRRKMDGFVGKSSVVVPMSNHLTVMDGGNTCLVCHDKYLPAAAISRYHVKQKFPEGR